MTDHLASGFCQMGAAHARPCAHRQKPASSPALEEVQEVGREDAQAFHAQMG